MSTVVFVIACPLFLISFAAYIFVKIHLAPKEDSDLDDYYHEFEHLHPGLAKYTKWSKITFTAAVIAALKTPGVSPAFWMVVSELQAVPL